MSKMTKSALITTYRALGDNEVSITEFAKGFMAKTITLDDLFLIEKPKNQAQGLALFGAYAFATFAMPVDAVMGFASVFTGKPDDVKAVLTQAPDLSSLTTALEGLASAQEAEADAKHAEKVSDGSAHKTYLDGIARKIKSAKEDGAFNRTNALRALDLADILTKMANESLAEDTTQKVAVSV